MGTKIRFYNTMAGMEMAEARAKKAGKPFPNPGEIIIIEAEWRHEYKKYMKLIVGFLEMSNQLVEPMRVRVAK